MWDKFGGIGLQLQDVAATMEISVKTNQEMASKFWTEQSREFQLLARDRHDPKLIKNHLLQPDPAMLARVRMTRTRNTRKEPTKVGRISHAGGAKISREKARETTAGSRGMAAGITKEKTRIRTGITAISGGRKNAR